MRCLALLLFLTVLFDRAWADLPVTVTAATDRDYYLVDARHQIYTEIQLSVPALPAGDVSDWGTVRNVAFVLDRSGSMDGTRMQALRDGLNAALARLGGQDIVSVVLFGSEVETVHEARPLQERGNLDALLAQVEPVGGAALYDALNQGAAQLRRHAGPKTSNLIVLVTDGPPTKGPRELADFARLAAALAEEGIAITTVGLGDEFNEDMLAALARAGNGHFRYAPQPAMLPEVLGAELAVPGPLAAREVKLTVEILSDSNEVESFGWVRGLIGNRTVTYRVPFLFAGQKVTVLLGTEMDPRRGGYRFLRLHTSWLGASDGQSHETTSVLEARLDADTSASARSANPLVVRTMVNRVISEGLQAAIEAIDKGDSRRALRELRRVRSDALSLNYSAEDPEAQASIRRLEAYLAEVQGRGLGTADRKTLRSGLNNQFDIPVAEEEDEPPAKASSSSYRK
jgi:Ca-activated chloride channel family protein